MGAASGSVEQLLGYLWQQQGSDLHLTAGAPPLVRVGGELHPIPNLAPLSDADTDAMARSLASDRQWAEFQAGHDVDFSFSWQQSARIRGNLFRQRDTTALALRMMPRHIPTFDELGLPQAIRDFARLPQGLVLVSGPTGSGKSTTLASIIDWINEQRSVHVLTIENPIEYVHAHKKSAVNQRAVGQDAESFASALRSALREDPDVIMVGEIRDLESIEFALTLAETGHLVFATVHTNDAPQAINRLVDVFPGDSQPQVRAQLAASLAGVVHQRLVPKIGGGLVAAFEILLANPPVRNLILQGKPGQLRNQIISFRREGMQTLESSLSDLVARGVVSYEDAIARCLNPKDIARPG